MQRIYAKFKNSLKEVQHFFIYTVKISKNFINLLVWAVATVEDKLLNC